MKRGYPHYYSHHHHAHPPFLKFVFFALAVIVFIKLLPFLLPLLLVFAGIAVFRGLAFGGCNWKHFGDQFRDQFDEKQKRKNDGYAWDDDEPVII